MYKTEFVKSEYGIIIGSFDPSSTALFMENVERGVEI
jgi:hypothetical protein